MENNMIAKCGTCGSIFESMLIEKKCPFCEDTLGYKQTSSDIIKYFDPNIPKLNHPLDLIYPKYSEHKNVEVIWNKNKHTSNHFLNIIPIFKNVEGRFILYKLCIAWDFDYSKVYGIFENIESLNKYYLDTISLDNILTSFSSDDLFLHIFTLPAKRENYEKFVSLLRDGSNFSNLSNYFQLYNSVNWNVLDDESRVHKTFYEFASVNYLLHLLQMIKIPNLFEDFDESLIGINMFECHPNVSRTAGYIPLNKFVEDQKDKESIKEEALKEDYYFLIENNINDYEDVYDYYTKIDEGAVAPAAVPLSVAAQRSTQVYNKLYDLGYRPSMNIYSRGEITSLCPTFKIGEEIYFIECNNNIMNGINKFNSIEEMNEILEEVYNEEGIDSLFFEIKNVPSSVMMFNLKSSKNNKDFITRLLDLRDKYSDKPNFNYEYDVTKEYKDNNSILSKFREIEINNSVLFKYSNTNYRLRNISWGGNKKGLLYVDNHDNVISFIICEDLSNDMNVYRDFPKDLITEISDVEVSSNFKNTDMDLEMIKRMYNKYKIDTIRVRNLGLKAKLEIDSNFKLIDNIRGTSIFKIDNNSSLNETIVLTEALNANKRKKIEDLIYNVFNRLDPTGSNTKKYKDLFKGMNDTKFNSWLNEFLKNPKKNFYLECLPNKNSPKIKNAVDALDYLKVPTEEYVYYRHDGHKEDPIRTRYKVPVLYINIRRLQQILSKKNTYSLDINKRNLKTG